MLQFWQSGTVHAETVTDDDVSVFDAYTFASFCGHLQNVCQINLIFNLISLIFGLKFNLILNLLFAVWFSLIILHYYSFCFWIVKSLLFTVSVFRRDFTEV